MPLTPNAHFDFNLPLQRLRLLWVNTSGAYVNGMHRCFPIEAVACLDDGVDFDLLATGGRLSFLSAEVSSGRRVSVSDRAIEDICSAVGIESKLKEHSPYSWVVVCPRPCRSLQ